MLVFKPKFKRNVDGIEGLVVVVVNHATTGKNLMVAFANEEAVVKTLKTGMATFFKTSEKRFWTKGETSGNFMRVVDIKVDCDGDALEYLALPEGDGLACHTLAPSCFYRSLLRPGNGKNPPKHGEDEELEIVDLDVHSSLAP